MSGSHFAACVLHCRAVSDAAYVCAVTMAQWVAAGNCALNSLSCHWLAVFGGPGVMPVVRVFCKSLLGYEPLSFLVLPFKEGTEFQVDPCWWPWVVFHSVGTCSGCGSCADLSALARGAALEGERLVLCWSDGQLALSLSQAIA